MGALHFKRLFSRSGDLVLVNALEIFLEGTLSASSVTYNQLESG